MSGHRPRSCLQKPVVLWFRQVETWIVLWLWRIAFSTSLRSVARVEEGATGLPWELSMPWERLTESVPTTRRALVGYQLHSVSMLSTFRTVGAWVQVCVVCVLLSLTIDGFSLSLVYQRSTQTKIDNHQKKRIILHNLSFFSLSLHQEKKFFEQIFNYVQTPPQSEKLVYLSQHQHQQPTPLTTRKKEKKLLVV